MAQLGTITIQAPVDPFLTVAEVSKIIGFSDKVIKKWAESGTFPPSVRIGEREYWTNTAIGVWIAWVQLCPQAAKLPETGKKADSEE